ncbi:hypothetical protein Purlil1_2618 [Purpureocillium lilacinum]|uniref:Uncharacterized protein n=2 Tax=Purpureocillium lilacinum TaxID=33203 RepID=A0ABR0C9T0_PURLI|nr:hypothetical protein Purlil1_2618 [Purpureocillium lilacinum]
MCLPCFPWTWTQYDDPLDSMPEHSTWAYDGNAWALQRIAPVSAGAARITFTCTFISTFTPHSHSLSSYRQRAPTHSGSHPPVSRERRTQRDFLQKATFITRLVSPPPVMPEAAAGAGGDAATDPPKRIRRVRSFNYVPPHVEAVATPARPAHVRFADECTLGATVSGNTTTNTTPQATTGSVSGTAVNAPQAKSEPARDCQPTSFPAVGPPPGSGYAAPAVLPQQWYTSADPTRSLSGPGPYAQYHQYPQYPQYQPHQLATGTGGFAGASYVNGQPVQVQQQQLPATTNMSIPYLAATGPAPPTEGLNFQPPVPDNSNGPMQHLYVPRYDAAPGVVGGAVHVQPAVHVGHQIPPVSIIYPNHHVLPVASAAAVVGAYRHGTVLVNGVPYYASASARLPPVWHPRPRVWRPSSDRRPSRRPRRASFTSWPALPSKHTMFRLRQRQRMSANIRLQPHPVPGTVPVGQPGYVVYQGIPQQLVAPVPAAQPQLPGQPVMISGQTYYPIAATPAGQPMPAIMQAAPAVAPATLIAGTAAAPVPVPHEVPGLGRTPQEEVLHQVQFAYNNKLFEPQDMKPGDDDPSRFYYVRELDGNWTQRSRYSIDQIPCRWYVTDEGWFYAVRLPD